MQRTIQTSWPKSPVPIPLTVSILALGISIISSLSTIIVQVNKVRAIETSIEIHKDNILDAIKGIKPLPPPMVVDLTETNQKLTWTVEEAKALRKQADENAANLVKIAQEFAALRRVIESWDKGAKKRR